MSGDEPTNNSGVNNMAQLQNFAPPAPSATDAIILSQPSPAPVVPTPSAPYVYNNPTVFPVSITPPVNSPVSIPGATPAPAAAPVTLFTPDFSPTFTYADMAVGTSPGMEFLPLVYGDPYTQEVTRYASAKTRYDEALKLDPTLEEPEALARQRENLLAKEQQLQLFDREMQKRGLVPGQVTSENFIPKLTESIYAERGINRPDPAKQPELAVAFDRSFIPAVSALERAALSGSADLIGGVQLLLDSAQIKYVRDATGVIQQKYPSIVINGPITASQVSSDPTKWTTQKSDYAGALALSTAALGPSAPETLNLVRNNAMVNEVIQNNPLRMAGQERLDDVGTFLLGHSEVGAKAAEYNAKDSSKFIAAIKANPQVQARTQLLQNAVANPEVPPAKLQAEIKAFENTLVGAMASVGQTPIFEGPLGTTTLDGFKPNWASITALGALGMSVYGQTIGANQIYERNREDQLEDRDWNYERQKELLAIQQGYALERIDANAAAESAGKGTPSGSVVSSNAKKGKSSI